MYISNEQCQNRNSKNCLLAEHIFAGTILIGRLPVVQEICDFLDVYCEIRARESGKPEVSGLLPERIAIMIRGDIWRGNIWTSRLR